MILNAISPPLRLGALIKTFKSIERRLDYGAHDARWAVLGADLLDILDRNLFDAVQGRSGGAVRSLLIGALERWKGRLNGNAPVVVVVSESAF